MRMFGPHAIFKGCKGNVVAEIKKTRCLNYIAGGDKEVNVRRGRLTQLTYLVGGVFSVHI